VTVVVDRQSRRQRLCERGGLVGAQQPAVPFRRVSGAWVVRRRTGRSHAEPVGHRVTREGVVVMLNPGRHRRSRRRCGRPGSRRTRRPPERLYGGGAYAYAVHHAHLAMLLADAHPQADAHYLADVLLAPLAAGLFLHHRQQGMRVDRIKAALDSLVTSLGAR
jgi:hypothetical protein